MERERNILKELLLKQLKKAAPISDKIIKSLKCPRYSSGKIIKYGDIPLFFLCLDEKSVTENCSDNQMSFSLVVLESREIGFYCKNYQCIKSSLHNQDENNIFAKKIKHEK
ncbi:MAG: hypothetical protein WC466_06545 [Candidatus Izemoplasmatales bacterium]